MAREIKFRVWDIKCMSMHNVKELGLLGGYVKAFGIKLFSSTITLGYKEFYLMQFTGLKDKHNKEIFEGDIVQMFDEDGDNVSKFKIQYEGASFVRIREDGEIFSLEKNIEFLEIIGNIYDTPHLYKNTKN